MPYSNPKQQKAAQHRWYLRNRAKVILTGRKHRIAKRKYLNKQKDKPCQDCGVRYPWYVMDFDHRDGEIKLSKISLVASSFGWEKLKAEVAKCDVVCANCHRIRTYKKKQRYGRTNNEV